jgi:hypothetical protein
MRTLFGLVPFVIACGPPARGDDPGGGGADSGGSNGGDAGPACVSPLPVAGPEVALAPPFDAAYTVYELGPVPGVLNPLGGTVVLASDPNTLLVAGGSETENGAIYRIGVSRDACGHITGFVGAASIMATTPYVDANLVYHSPDLLLYTEWPQYELSQLAGPATTPDRRVDLRTLGMSTDDDLGPGGLGLVPPPLAAEHELRLVTWPGGRWYHVATAADGGLLQITSIAHTTTIPNDPGGFAYVPAGSPEFARQSMIVAEWRRVTPSSDRVAVYEVDDAGDPIVATRREFFHTFPRPWGAYFEPVTGDYLFLSWGTGNDRVYIVQGFVPPPPIL